MISILLKTKETSTIVLLQGKTMKTKSDSQNKAVRLKHSCILTDFDIRKHWKFVRCSFDFYFYCFYSHFCSCWITRRVSRMYTEHNKMLMKS